MDDLAHLLIGRRSDNVLLGGTAKRSAAMLYALGAATVGRLVGRRPPTLRCSKPISTIRYAH